MADEKPSLHIDTDWKRQAQEEKKRLVEEEAKKAKEAAMKPAPAAAASVGVGPAAAARGAKGEGMPGATFSTLVQSLLTQTLFYLGDLSARGGEPSINLDMAKHQLDTLTVLEEKTKGNLTPEESALMDTALYETRARFVNVASQFL